MSKDVVRFKDLSKPLRALLIVFIINMVWRVAVLFATIILLLVDV